MLRVLVRGCRCHSTGRRIKTKVAEKVTGKLQWFFLTVTQEVEGRNVVVM